MPRKRSQPSSKIKTAVGGSVRPKDGTRTQPKKSSPSSLTVAVLAAIIAVGAALIYAARIQLTADVSRREAIKDAMKYAWGEYEKYALGDDNYHPISKHGSNLTSAGGIGYTMVDALDSLMIMGLDDEVARVRDWIQKDLSFDRDASFNTFEVTIRVLGGLLSAYYISSIVPSSSSAGEFDDLYLQKAVDLGDRLLGAFKSPINLPYPSINLATYEGIPDKDNGILVSTAEIATLQVELKYLSHLTGDDKYWHAAEHVMKVIKNSSEQLESGLVSVFLRSDNGQFIPSDIRLGSRGDSYYEYLLPRKQYVFNSISQSEPVYRQMYDKAVESMNKYLITQSPTDKIMHTTEIIPQRGGRDGRSLTWRQIPKQDHLVCFIGGLFLLGATEGKGPVPPDVMSFSESELRDWKNGVGMIKGCMETHQTLTGLSPEIAHFRTDNDPKVVQNDAAPRDWYIKGAGSHDSYDARYMLRPETVESLFIAHRLTGHPKYREWGWEIFQAIEKHAKLPEGGYATVLNVDRLPVKHDDRMETFFLSETLKYLYLLFDDHERFSPRDVVFNTEAHIFPKFDSTIETGFD
ncbi:uncharacterized protein EI90DRAFT_3144066 [Cantharellus anzutake]|uniref:uncharacterized protein n=1 Tax=Cantharellus anzutake TaxID=1750568 RepID=UPI00190764F8|nr:uncharacterized protein EI90DRAFT_3144066 [Cantharellus anzutake]KAF8339752.1 hypothetical protein EI90DRAFT_3144066 [Cantharellus anzutake]